MVILPNPTLAPRSLRHYGETPFGDPLWRCVYAPSVKKLVGGKFPDGFTGYRARPAYRHIGDYWVLEKWISAFDMTHMSESRYNETYQDPQTKLCAAGPYPSRGVYHYCETLSCTPADTNFDILVALITKAKYNRPQDNMNALMKTMEAKDKADAAERFDRCKELMPAMGIRAANFGGHVKATKSAPMMRSANELGLPTHGPKVQEVNRAI